MSYRLYFFIATPFMILSLIFGFALLLQSFFYMKMGWFHLKLTLLFLLICYHFFIGYTLSRFIKGEVFLSSLQCRLIGPYPYNFFNSYHIYCCTQALLLKAISEMLLEITVLKKVHDTLNPLHSGIRQSGKQYPESKYPAPVI